MPSAVSDADAYDGLACVRAAGDSRCVLVQRSGKAVPLSTDHKVLACSLALPLAQHTDCLALQPDRPEERERITSRGGQVVFWGVWRTQGVLAVSR